MLTPRRYHELGTANHGWLDAHFHFSFAAYHDPEHMGFGDMRVINDDIISAGGGFGMHPHRDMEIITYVREGAITHEDSLGNKGVTRAGDAQIMSAGTGIVHSEYNHEDTPTRLYQIWIHPRAKGLAPRWETRQFPKESGGLHPLVSGAAEHQAQGALMLHQDATIWGGVLNENQPETHPFSGHLGYMLVSRGEVILNGLSLAKGDGVYIEHEEALNIVATKPESEIVLIELAG